MRTSTLAILGTCAVLAVSTAAGAQSKCTAAKIKAAGKKAQCKLGVDAKGDAKNVSPDTAKLQGCTDKFTAAFAKAETNSSGCIAPNGDVGAIEGKVDTFVNDVQSTEATGNLGTSGSKCVSSKVKAAGKKAACKLGILSKAAAKNLGPDTAKLAGCEGKFSAAFMKAETAGDCNTATGDTTTIEGKVDAFVSDVNGELTSATTTSTTTTSTTTTTTMLLRFATTIGTTSCGAAGLSPGASAPVAGELDSDTGCSTHLVDLGQSCLYFGGGKATVVPPGPVPDGSEYRFTVPAAGTITGNPGTGPSNCTLGDGPGKHCINGFCNTDADCGNVAGACQSNRCNPGTQTTPLSCTADASCGGCAGCCGLDANCFF
ncbi:MAG TPA: hypothetical protein VKU61_07220, partial [Candidatus Binatia bacterium]|nr:hypothetical protein [Candidatus Binatia bacterium]